MDSVALGLACIQPTLLKIRAKDMDVKTQAYSELTRGQRALMMFRVLHGHVGDSADQLFAWVDVLLREEPRTWSAIKDAMRLIEDEAMLRMLEEFEVRDASAQEPLHTQYHSLADETHKRIAAYIRNHPDEFVQLED
ncbi:MAG: hypothetical protein WCC10_09380 [Tumebacillaceae bacterium]